MANCYYHPEAKGTATCPECRMQICDRCRLRGNGERCQNCQSELSKGGKEDSRPKRTMCLNHEGTPTDTTCKQCRKPHCVACLNGAQLCFRCAMAGPRQQTGQLKARGTTKLEAPKSKIPPKAWAAGGGVLLVLLIGGALMMRGPSEADEGPFLGKSGVQIVSPSNKRTLSGNQVIKIKVASAEAVDKVEVTIDGKYWEKYKDLEKATLSSDWPTGIFPNGSHDVLVKVTYRGGRRMAADKRRFKVRNK